jgi:LacI family transcriptional regulator
MKSGRVTIAEVARVAGVSKATVSVVLNGRTDAVAISQATQATVIETARRLGYTPNYAARALRRQRSGVVNLLISTLINPYFTEITAAAHTAAEARDYQLNIIDVSQPGTKSRALEQLRGGGADGVIVATGLSNTQGADLDLLQEMVRRGLPAVLLLDRSPDPAIPGIRVDHEAGIYLGVRHLLDLGHRRIGFLTVEGTYPAPSDEVTSRADRFRGYQRALREAGLSFEPAWLYQGQSATLAVGQTLTHALLASPAPRPTALIAANDQLAIGALRAAYEAGARVPDDLAVVGFGGIELGRYTTPALSTVDNPRAMMGQLATETLLDLLRGIAPAEIERIVPIRFLVRESCGGKQSP